MAALLTARSSRGRRNLLETYTAQCGKALRRNQSAVALRAARVDAELAYRARGAFLASMNHELRTPLNAITGFAGLLRSASPGSLPEEKAREYLDYILQSAEVLLSHLNTILEIADAESGGAKLSRRAFDIRDVVREVVGLASGEDTDKSERIALDLSEETPLIDGDPDKIGVALHYLVGFIDEVSSKTAFRLAVRRGLPGKGEGFVFVSIEQRASGLTSTDVNQALRVFERVHEGLDRGFDQRRLGLPIAKSYIELHGGRFSIKVSHQGDLLIRIALPVSRNRPAVQSDRPAS